MKKLALGIFIVLFTLTFTNNSNAKVKLKISGGVYFKSELQAYGNWYKLRGGITVWRPANVSFNWQPYKYGRWFSTYDGWYWDSYEDFGFITYHYGRWYFDDYYGWVWVPGNRWAPAWVDWRYDDDYIGWAPLPPYAEFSVRVGIHFSNNFHYGYRYWNFVRYSNFCSPYVYNYFSGPKYKYRIYSRTKYRNNYRYRNGRVINRGVDLKYVRKRSGRRIVSREIKRVSTVRDIKKRNSKKYVRSYVYSKTRSKTRIKNRDRNYTNRDRKTLKNKVNTRTRINRTERKRVFREKRTNPKRQRIIERRTKRRSEVKNRVRNNTRRTIIKRRNYWFRKNIENATCIQRRKNYTLT